MANKPTPPAEEVKPTVAIEKTPISQDDYDQLVAQKAETDQKLIEAEKARKEQDEVIEGLKGLLKEASETTVKVVVDAGLILKYKEQFYQATQAAYWFKHFKARPIPLKELSEEQIESLISEGKLVEVQ